MFGEGKAKGLVKVFGKTYNFFQYRCNENMLKAKESLATNDVKKDNSSNSESTSENRYSDIYLPKIAMIRKNITLFCY